MVAFSARGGSSVQLDLFSFYRRRLRLAGLDTASRRGGGSGRAVRRGSGEPVHTGRGVAGSGGVNTALGATEGADALNGVGEVTAPRSGVETVTRRDVGSYLTEAPSARSTGPIMTYAAPSCPANAGASGIRTRREPRSTTSASPSNQRRSASRVSKGLTGAKRRPPAT